MRLGPISMLYKYCHKLNFNVDMSLLTVSLSTSSQARTDMPKVTYQVVDGRLERSRPANTAMVLRDILFQDRIQNNIFPALFNPTSGLVFDLDARTMSSRVPSILQINATIRRIASDLFPGARLIFKAELRSNDRKLGEVESLAQRVALARVPKPYTCWEYHYEWAGKRELHLKYMTDATASRPHSKIYVSLQYVLPRLCLIGNMTPIYTYT